MSGYLTFSAKHPALAKIAERLNEAGNAYHNTIEWGEDCKYNAGDKSYNELIQEAFDEADAAVSHSMQEPAQNDGKGGSDET